MPFGPLSLCAEAGKEIYPQIMNIDFDMSDGLNRICVRQRPLRMSFLTEFLNRLNTANFIVSKHNRNKPCAIRYRILRSSWSNIPFIRRPYIGNWITQTPNCRTGAENRMMFKRRNKCCAFFRVCQS